MPFNIKDLENDVTYVCPPQYEYITDDILRMSNPMHDYNKQAAARYIDKLVNDFSLKRMSKRNKVEIGWNEEKCIITIEIDGEVKEKLQMRMYDFNDTQHKILMLINQNTFEIPKDTQCILPPPLQHVEDYILLRSDPFHDANKVAAVEYIEKLKSAPMIQEMVHEGKHVQLYWDPKYCIIFVIVDHSCKYKFQTRLYELPLDQFMELVSVDKLQSGLDFSQTTDELDMYKPKYLKERRYSV